MPGDGDRYLLDTNIAVHVLNQKVDLAARLSRGRQVYLDVTVVGELLYGAAKSGRPEDNRQRIERLLEVCPVVPHDLMTAARYGQLKAGVQAKGRMIPENDLWIAASAIRYGLTLVTRDRHFDAIDEISLEVW